MHVYDVLFVAGPFRLINKRVEDGKSFISSRAVNKGGAQRCYGPVNKGLFIWRFLSKAARR